MPKFKDKFAIRIPKKEFLALVREYPDLALTLLNTYSRRLRSFVSLLHSITLYDVKTRLATFLLKNSSMLNNELVCQLPYSKKELITRIAFQLQIKSAFLTLEENFKLKSALQEQEQQKEVAKIEFEKSNLEKLRYQLNPHFLFNALASIRGAIMRDPVVASSKRCL